ncbi:hypothetical protein H7H82_14850 [Mycobacterium heidelbergense]|uniref:DUF7159 family protein n=1 Tax=Mycobacterium heidelbergense TaxID=53376 RepID=UPI0009F68EAF|nr:hypothetical protein [Mycobacterium heidelbergense]MCV7051854.1 hypothetical protein [Mycobacterium heidelbergense]BBZ49830.1 hypothetical protein MHEI_15470 [Mycobacterium heidelbergense]
MDIVLGVSMAPASIKMVVLEGENADGPTVEEDEFDVTAADDAATAGAPDQVIAAILGTREGAADAGLELSAIGVTWTDQFEAAALRDALAAHKIENVMLVSAFLAATALAQSVGGAMGYERTAVLFVEPDAATLAIVETSDGSIADVHKQQIYAESYDQATAQLTGMVAGLDRLEALPGGLFLVGSGVDIAPIKPALESATALDVSAPEEPETALARGAALASANAPLFASSTAALAYAQDPGTGAVDLYAYGDQLGDDERAYSAVTDEDAESPTVLIERLFAPEQDQPRRRPVLLIGSGLAVVGISAVLALEIALAIGIRTTVALRPTPGQNLIVPTQQAPVAAPAAAVPAQPKISLPAQMAAPRPANPPAAPLPAAPPVPAAPLPVNPVAPAPLVVPPLVPVPVPPVHLPIPNPVVSPPVVQAPPHPVVPKAPVHVSQPQSPYQGGDTVPHSPPHQAPPEQGPLPRPGGLGGEGGGHLPAPGAGPGGDGGVGPIHVPGGGPGDVGGAAPPSGPGPFGGGAPPAGPGPFGGAGPFGGGHGGAPTGPGPFGGGGAPAVPGPFGGGGPFGGAGPFGGGHGGGGPFGGGGFGGGGHGGFGGFGGFGGGHGGGGFGGGGFGGGGGHR